VIIKKKSGLFFTKKFVVNEATKDKKLKSTISNLYLKRDIYLCLYEASGTTSSLFRNFVHLNLVVINHP